MLPPTPGSSLPSRPAGATRLPPAEALRLVAQLTDTEEDLQAVTRVVLALVGEDDALTGPAAEIALARGGVPAEARRLLLAAAGPASGRPSVAELRAGLERAAAGAAEAPAPPRTGIARLFEELQRRRVTRTALWYVGGSVAVVEAANLFVPMLGGDVEVVRLLAILSVCGLPIALALSWAFDLGPSARLHRWPRLALLGGVAALSLFAAAMVWRATAGSRAIGAAAATSATADPAHIAVLGFTAVGGGDDLAAFASQLQVRLIDGLSAEALATSSSSAPAQRASSQESTLRVLSYAGVLPFVGRGFAVDSLREARRVGTVLEGTVEQVAGRVRVRVRLVDTQTGFQIHTSSADHPVGDRVALLDALADSVSRLVRTRLGPVVRDRLRLLETHSPEAFDRLLWAQRRLEEFTVAFDGEQYAAAERALLDADSSLALAGNLDPQWLEPIVMRGRMAKRWVRLALVQRDSARVLPAIEHGIALAERALDIRPTDPRALELRGELGQFRLQVTRVAGEAAARLRAAAERDLQASLLGHPAPAAPLRMLSELAAADGRMREALDYGERALQQDPFMEQAPFTTFRLFEYSFALGNDSAAVRWCRTGRERFPDQPTFHDCRLSLAAWAGAPRLGADSAWALVGAELAAYPPPLRPVLEPRLHALVAAVLARQGARDSARAVLRAAMQSDSSVGVLRTAAGVHAILRQPDSALAVLQALLAKPGADRRALLGAIELRDVLREPRARALVTAQPARRPAN